MDASTTSGNWSSDTDDEPEILEEGEYSRSSDEQLPDEAGVKERGEKSRGSDKVPSDETGEAGYCRSSNQSVLDDSYEESREGELGAAESSEESRYDFFVGEKCGLESKVATLELAETSEDSSVEELEIVATSKKKSSKVLKVERTCPCCFSFFFY